MSSAVRQYLLPKDNHHPQPPIPAARVSLVAIKIRYLIVELISVEVKVHSLWLSRIDLVGDLRDSPTLAYYYRGSIEIGLGSRRR